MRPIIDIEIGKLKLFLFLQLKTPSLKIDLVHVIITIILLKRSMYTVVDKMYFLKE